MTKGFSWASLPESTKVALGRLSSAAIRLWETTIGWHNPVQALSLYTTPGVNYCSPLVNTLSDFLTRWCLSSVAGQGMKGRVINTKEEWEAYIATPDPTYPTNLIPFRLIVAVSNEPIWVNETPGNTAARQGEQGRIATFTRKGKSIQRGGKKSLPTPMATPKYSSRPQAHFRLSPSALPPGTPHALIDSAQEAFAASISASTQTAYKTTWMHLQKAEAMLGQKFSSPPTEREMVFFTSFLTRKNIAPVSIKSYLSALRYISPVQRGHPAH